MKSVVIIITVPVCLILSGCVGPLVPVSNVEDSTADELARTIQIYDAASTPRATILSPITATSCKNKLWDKDATPENATAQLRLLARQAGGNAVGNLTCEPSQGTSLAKNCWSSVVCTGTAIRVGDPQPAPLTRRR